MKVTSSYFRPPMILLSGNRRVVDLSVRKVYDEKVSSPVLTVDLAGRASGTYLLVFVDGATMATNKLVKY